MYLVCVAGGVIKRQKVVLLLNLQHTYSDHSFCRRCYRYSSLVICVKLVHFAISHSTHCSTVKYNGPRRSRNVIIFRYCAKKF